MFWPLFSIAREKNTLIRFHSNESRFQQRINLLHFDLQTVSRAASTEAPVGFNLNDCRAILTHLHDYTTVQYNTRQYFCCSTKFC